MGGGYKEKGFSRRTLFIYFNLYFPIVYGGVQPFVLLVSNTHVTVSGSAMRLALDDDPKQPMQQVGLISRAPRSN